VFPGFVFFFLSPRSDVSWLATW